MTVKDFNLLEIDMFENDKLIYSGMCEDVPAELKDKQIRIKDIDNKKLIVEII